MTNRTGHGALGCLAADRSGAYCFVEAGGERGGDVAQVGDNIFNFVI